MRWLNRFRRWWSRRDLLVWHDSAYRLPLANLEQAGMEPRRADFVAWYLIDRHVIEAASLRTPTAASYEDIGRVHSDEYLETLSRPATLARIFAADESEVQVDEILRSVRLAVGGTIEAARTALARRMTVMNLLGGFHHAGPASGGGFCAMNDLAIAVAAVRAEGFRGRVAIIDLDAHPPDGTAACFARDENTWIGSISGSDWGVLPHVDETILPKGAGDDVYLVALEQLLSRMPASALAFVVAGGDVLAGDRLGALGLSLEGVRRRDLMVADALERVPSVWVPGGGYSVRSWCSLAGTALALSLRSQRPIRPDYDPLTSRYAAIAAGLPVGELGGDDLDTRDIEAALGLARGRRRLLLDFYSSEGLEYALFRYGILGHLGRLGYGRFRVALDDASTGERVRLLGVATDAPPNAPEELLVETVLEKQRLAGGNFLYVHWLTLRHPKASFDVNRPKLPGQEVPGLGMARESGEMLSRMAARLGLDGVAFRPAWFHTAYAARYRGRFADPARQGRFEAMVRDLSRVPLLEVTIAVSEGRVRMNGEPYTWEAEPMLFWLESPLTNGTAAQVAAERERVRFEIVPRAEEASGQASGAASPEQR